MYFVCSCLFQCPRLDFDCSFNLRYSFLFFLGLGRLRSYLIAYYTYMLIWSFTLANKSIIKIIKIDLIHNINLKQNDQTKCFIK
jgi:hypothetical protein